MMRCPVVGGDSWTLCGRKRYVLESSAGRPLHHGDEPDFEKWSPTQPPTLLSIQTIKRLQEREAPKDTLTWRVYTSQQIRFRKLTIVTGS